MSTQPSNKYKKMLNYFESDNLLKEKEVARRAREDYEAFQKLSAEEQSKIKRQRTYDTLMNQYNNAKEIYDRSKQILDNPESKTLAINLAIRQLASSKNTLSGLRTSFRSENLPFPGASSEFVAVGEEGNKHIIPRDYLK